MGILPGPGGAVSKVADEIRRFAARHPLTGPGVVAVSGGADSVALLRGLREAGFGPLTVAHVNHHLRGEESDADERFVVELADRLASRCRVERVAVAQVAGAARDNMEATARRARYDFLARLAAEVGAGWIATGHTADDQAETVLHRLIRGTGLQGLRGIAAERVVNPSPRRGGEGSGGSAPLSPPSLLGKGAGGLGSSPRIVRPLLSVTRADVLDYLAALGQPYREDSSNADVLLTRNRIRHELLPLLGTYNPAIADVLGRLAHQADEVFALQEQQASTWLWECELPRAGGVVVLDPAIVHMMPDVMLREVVRLIWRREGWPTNGMTFDHWDRVVRVAHGDVPAADFPGGVHVRHAGRVVQLGRRE